MKRILLDQGLAPRAAAIRSDYGFGATHVADIGREKAEDVDILERARSDESVCVAPAHDFSR
jgi:predicted nuclease of predicted toxin-antitoxin system